MQPFRRIVPFRAGVRLAIGALAGLVFSIGLPAPGQSPPKAAPPAPAPEAAGVAAKAAGAGPGLAGDVTEESLTRALEEAKADTGLDDASRTEVTRTLESALAAVKSAADASAKAEAFRQELEQAPAEISKIRGDLKAREGGTAPLDPPLPKDATAEAIQARLTAEKSRLSEVTRNLRLWEDQLAAIETRPTALRDRLIEARRLLSEAEGALAGWNGKPAGTIRERAARAAAQATVLALGREIALLDQEALGIDLRRSLLEARRDLANADLAAARDRVAALERRAEALVSARLGEAEKLLGEKDLAPVREHTLVRDLIGETKRLTAETQSLLGRIGEADRGLKAAQAELDRLRRDSENIRAQIEIGGLEDSFAQVILEIRGQLPSERDRATRATARRKSIAAARMAAFHAERDLESLPPPDAQRDLILGSLRSAGIPDSAAKPLRPVLESLIDTHRRLLRDVVDENRRLSRQLGEVELAESEILSLAEDLKHYLGEQLLWVASSPPMGLDAVSGLPAALAAVAGPGALAAYGTALARVEWPQWLLVAAAAVLFLLPRPRWRKYLADSALRTRRISRDGLGNTVRALGATLLLALPGPAALWLLAGLFSAESGSSETVFAAGKALQASALPLLAIRFSAMLCRPGGLGEAHFRWSRPGLERCRRALAAVTLVYPPSVGLLAFWLNSEDPAHFQGPGRLVFLIWMGSLAAITWRLLGGPDSLLNLPAQGSRKPLPPHWLIRLRRFWVPFVTGLPLALAGFAAMGHFLTAVALTYQIQTTALIILLCLVAYGVLSRWVILKERRLALKEAVAQREARLAAPREPAAGPDQPAVTESVVPADDDDEDLDLETLGSQTRRLIGAVLTVVALLTVWVAWSEAIPVLKFLDSRQVIGSVSIADLVTLTLIAVIVSVVFQNLPGLLEVSFLRALELESGSRNAIVTIFQYLVIAIGVAVAFQTLGLDWSQFGWIAAALSVGLGFGLQEVVANFVSGLILLLERPIRVGDTVTVAGVDGVVSRIRIRATTITNWDRKEFVVPNKEFVTGTLLNWTLSSSVTRLVIPVGVAYGSDTKRVQELLVDIARSHPEVLDDPAPQAVFELFGESTLNFTVRCFLPSPAERLDATHYINCEIHRRFAEAGIEIAYPQRDLHLRSIHPSVTLGLREQTQA